MSERLARPSINEGLFITSDDLVTAGVVAEDGRIIVQKHLLEPHEGSAAQNQKMHGQLQQQQNMLGGLGMASDRGHSQGSTTGTPSGQGASDLGHVNPSQMQQLQGMSGDLDAFNLVPIGDHDEDGVEDFLVEFHSGPRQTTSMDGTRQIVTSEGPRYQVSDNNERQATLGPIVIAADLDGDGTAEQLAGVPAGDLDGDGASDYAVGSKLAIKTKGAQQAQGFSKRSAERAGGGEGSEPDGYGEQKVQEGGKNDGAHKRPGPARFSALEVGAVVMAAGDVDGDGEYEQLSGVVVADLDGDGMADLVVGAGGGGGKVDETHPEAIQGGKVADTIVVESRSKGRYRLDDADDDGVIDALDDDSDGDGIEDFAVGDVDGDGDIEHAFPIADLDGDGVWDFIVLSGFSNGDTPEQERKAAHEVALNAIRNMKGMAVNPTVNDPPPPPSLLKGDEPGVSKGLLSGTAVSEEERKKVKFEKSMAPSGGSIFEDGTFELIKLATYVGVKPSDLLDRKGQSTRNSDGLVFNIVNPRAARDNHLQGGVDVIEMLASTDTDDDGQPDYLDDDDDGDAIEDYLDPDSDGDSVPDYDELKLLVDADKDGKVSGWELLGAFDKNNDGKITREDPIFDKLAGLDQDDDGDIAVVEIDGYAGVGKPFVLDGSRSTDDGTISTFDWKQVSGPFKFSSQSGDLIGVDPQSDNNTVSEAKPQAPRDARSQQKPVGMEDRRTKLTTYDDPDPNVSETGQVGKTPSPAGPVPIPYPNVTFHGYENEVEVTNEQGTEVLGEGQTIDVEEGSAPSPPHASGPEAEEFRKELLTQFETGDIPTDSDFADTIDSDFSAAVIFNPKEYNLRLQQLVTQAHALEVRADALWGKVDNTDSVVGASDIESTLHVQQLEELNIIAEALATELAALVETSSELAGEEKQGVEGLVVDDPSVQPRRAPAAEPGASGLKLGIANGGVERGGAGELQGILIGLLEEIEAALASMGVANSDASSGNLVRAQGSADTGNNDNWDFGGELRNRANISFDPRGSNSLGRDFEKNTENVSGGLGLQEDGPDEGEALAAKQDELSRMVSDLVAHFDKWSELLNTLAGIKIEIGAAGQKSAGDLAVRIIQDGNLEEGDFADIGPFDDQLDALIARAMGLHTQADEAAYVLQQKHSAQMNDVQSNPLYKDDGVTGENPMHEKSIDGVGIEHEYIFQNNQTDLEFLRVSGEVLDGLLQIEQEAASLAGILKGMSWGGGIK
ncbi:MAG: DUF4150 domain-containing protein, partial [bacterium]|nr:DUF4150 domain-containing protein [bacterium]